MRVALVAMLILLLPAALFAGPMLGVYFTYNPGQMTYNPELFELFYGYVFATNYTCFLSAIEFMVDAPSGITVNDFESEWPDLVLGSPLSGVSMSFPPGYPPYDGYHWIMTLHLEAYKTCCHNGGTMQDAPLYILPNPESGYLRGSCPDGTLFEFAGLTSIFCPFMIGTEEESWGAIKSLF